MLDHKEVVIITLTLKNKVFVDLIISTLCLGTWSKRKSIWGV